MNVSIGSHWEDFVERLVKSGRYGSASEVVRDALRLMETREAKIAVLREEVQASIAEGGRYTADDVREHLKATRNERRHHPDAAE